MSKTYSNSISLVRVIDGTDGSSNYIHIRYSDYSDGTEMSTEPKAYMGVYNGASVEAPTDPSLYKWSKIVGQDGQDGQDGQNAPEVKAQYNSVFSATDSNWTEDFDNSIHKYIRFSYDDGKTWSIAIKIVGDDANPYFIETNYEEFLRFETKAGVSFSPEVITFRVYDQNDFASQNANPIDLENGQWSLSYFNKTSAEFEQIANKIDIINFPFLTNEHTSNQIEIVSLQEDNENYNTIYFSIVDFLTKYTNEDIPVQSWLQGEDFPLFKFVYIQNNKAVAQKIINFRNGVHSDMAKLNINAADITASIQDASLKFSANGLQLDNGDFVIVNPNYIKTTLEITADNFGQYELYVIDNNNNFVKAEIFEEGKEYYQRQEEKVFYADEKGNLNLRGNVYATDGVFRGDIFANNGTFNGEINAINGTIGGFNIVSNYYVPTDEKSFSQGETGYFLLLDPINATYCEITHDSTGYYTQAEYKFRYYKIADVDQGFDSKLNYYIYSDNRYIQVDIKDSDNKPLSPDRDKTYYQIWWPFSGYYVFNEEGEYVEVNNPIEGVVYWAKIDDIAESILYINQGSRLSSPGNEIILDGTNGQIIAENISLGGGAKISDRLVFSSEEGKITAALFNPEKYDGKILESGLVTLNNSGLLNLGTIELYSGTGNLDGYLRSKRVDGNGQTLTGNWIIREDGTAQFNNLIANQVKLQETVLEIGTVQSIGSLMLFKDAWAIKAVEKVYSEETQEYIETKITLDTESEAINLEKNDLVVSNSIFYKIISIDTEGKVIVNDESSKLQPGSVLTKFGKQGDHILSILGEENNTQAAEDYATGNSLTIASLDSITSSTPSFTKHLILGDLSKSGIDEVAGIGGFGLYSDNVYLNGSLATKIEPNKYAGINTIQTVSSNKFGGNDNSNIVFWGGASSTEASDIQNAPFQVTAQGSVYASQGVFEGSLISKSIIQGSDIYAARIHGGTQSGVAPLAIYDTGENNGIGFYSGFNTESETELFKIRGDGFKKGDNYFIKLKNSPLFIGDFATGTNRLNIAGNQISFIFEDTGPVFNLGSENDVDNTNEYKLYINYKSDTETKTQMEIQMDKISNKVSTYLEKDLFLGSKLHYTQIKNSENEIIGYDLYIE